MKNSDEIESERFWRGQAEYEAYAEQKYSKCEKAVETYGSIGWCTMAEGHGGDCYDDNAEPRGVQ